MTIVLVTAARNAACDAVTDLVDGGAGAGKLKIRSAGAVLLCTITLDDPAFDPAAVGVAIAAGLPLSGVGAVAAGAGTAATNYEVTDSNDVIIWTGNTPGSLTLDNVNIASGQAVNVTAWTHTQPA